jgi:predicted esterase
MFLLLLPAALVVLSTTQSVAEDPPAALDPIHHALVQKKVGFYAVYLPPDYNAEPNKEKTWPVCIILHGSGSTETGHGALSATFGRKGIIYLAPRAPHTHFDVVKQSGNAGYTAWPDYPESWGAQESDTFPKDEIEKLEAARLYTDWIADCLADVRKRYRTDGERAVIVGHSQGAEFAHTFALHRPELVRAYFAYAGFYDYSLQDDIAAQTLKKHKIHAHLAHCEGDAVVNVTGTNKLSEYLKKHEVAHDLLIVPGGSHRFTSKTSRAASEFVAKWCRGEQLPPLEGKLVVTTVVADSQAAQAGLKEGDVLTSYNGQAIKNLDDLQDAMAGVEQDSTEDIEIVWKRGEEEMKAKVKPGRLGVMLADR